MREYFAGLDLGQVRDYSALAIVSQGAGTEGARQEANLEVRHLERFPLGSRYSEVARRVATLMGTPPLVRNCELAVDATGVGIAVTDQLRDEGLFFKSVVITGGDRESHNGMTYRVPKRNLVSRPQVLLQNRRLKIAPALPESGTLVEELLNFRVKVDSRTAHDSYEHWREGDHDDLVLALALAVWSADRGGPVPGPDMLIGGLFYYPDEELFFSAE